MVCYPDCVRSVSGWAARDLDTNLTTTSKAVDSNLRNAYPGLCFLRVCQNRSSSVGLRINTIFVGRCCRALSSISANENAPWKRTPGDGTRSKMCL